MSYKKINRQKEETTEQVKQSRNNKEAVNDGENNNTQNPEEEVELREKTNEHEEKITGLEKKLEEISDKHLRLQAEFDNFRRRTIKEKADLIKAGGESVLVTVLPIIDDFERALDSLKNVPDNDAGKQGTMLIYSKFKDFLKQNNVKEIDALNQNFDVDLHEAVTKIPVQDDKQKGKVVDVIQKGYTLNDKVIRFAKVVIGE